MSERRLPTINKSFGYIVTFVVIAGLSGCAKAVLPVECDAADFPCFSKQFLADISETRAHIAYWSNLHLILQIFIAVAGITATIMIALQGDDNRYWTRPIGLVATALVTGLSSALVSFHVPENIDKLIDTAEKMTATANEFDREATKLKAGRSPEEIQEAFKTDPKFREAVNELTYKYATDFNKTKIEMLRLSGTAAKLTSIPSPPQPPKKD
jgi:hypothetical protein